LIELFIDTGGTFTDCIARFGNGEEKRLKVLSNATIRGILVNHYQGSTYKVDAAWDFHEGFLKDFSFRTLKYPVIERKVLSFDSANKYITLDSPLPDSTKEEPLSFELSCGEEAPVLAARILTGTPLSGKLPPMNIKLGTTRGTNALLEKKGARVLMVVTRGFKDLLRIGTQERPDIFKLNVVKPTLLPENILEADECTDAKGKVVNKIDKTTLGQILTQPGMQDADSVGVCLKNSVLNDENEKIFESVLKESGYENISVSSGISRLIKYLPRMQTTFINAYLDPVIKSYVRNVARNLEQGRLHIMTSSGGLMDSGYFQPKDSLLSGPAGGVVGAAASGMHSGRRKLITFDMGGTSTDVSRYDGKPDYKFELKIADAYIFSPAVSVETVAAGGGSVCGFDGYRLFVGPESAGSFPGPACYGAGGPLTLTDVNLLAGRLDVKEFNIPVFKAESEKKLNLLLEKIKEDGGELRTREQVLNGFIRIADEIMAGAIRKISISKGYDPGGYSLLAFGGAGGIHACGIAELLNINEIIIPEDAGILSAYGIASADLEANDELQVIQLFRDWSGKLKQSFSGLVRNASGKLTLQGVNVEDIEVKYRAVFLRLKGQESTLEVEWKEDTGDVLERFKDRYRKVYGYFPEGQHVEIESLRVIVAKKGVAIHSGSDHGSGVEIVSPLHYIKALNGNEWIDAPVYIRDNLPRNAVIKGYAVVLDKHCTIAVKKGWSLTTDSAGSLVIAREEITEESKEIRERDVNLGKEADLELFTNRFMGIAEDMGAMLQRTAFSVNVKERLDFSCALLSEDGKLVANAPHIPVHLGSLGVCVRMVKESVEMHDGDIIVTNHPAYGGSHLPDITLICPVFYDSQLLGYLVNRAHHAEIGGITPASMPAHATSLAEEGVIIPPFHLMKNGVVDWEGMRRILTEYRYPSRSVEENLADLNAGIASLIHGRDSLLELVAAHGVGKVREFMYKLFLYAGRKTRSYLNTIPAGVFVSQEYLDDGTCLAVKITVEKDSCVIDFSGTSGVHPGNMNANIAIVNSVVVYVLRTLLDEQLPLNDGILDPVTILTPSSLLNPSFPEDPMSCPAIVGGNVEVRQRLTDTLLKAFGLVACSQGTMNNIMFGNESFGYYETICGGCGAGEDFHGASAVHQHMTNTRITDPEIMENRYPLIVNRFEIRTGSGGNGIYKGGDGVIREITFLEPVSLSILSQHRIIPPYGMNGGEPGKTGSQHIVRKDGSVDELNGVDEAQLNAGDRLVVITPGGGGYGVV